MENRIHVSVISHIGNSRENQEDNFLVHQKVYLPSDVRDNMSDTRAPYYTESNIDANRFLAVVSDGMGGHSCGEVASMFTVRLLSEHYDEILDSIKVGENALAQQLSRINRAMNAAAKSNRNYNDMGATLVGVLINEYDLVGFNIGDSRLYQFSDNKLIQLSTDHTEGQRMIDMHLLTEEEVKKFPRRKMLYRYIGYNGDIVPDVFRINSITKGTILMLCSDGLTDVVSDIEIERILSENSNFKEKSEKLVDKALSRNIGHGDNITIILIGF